MARNAQTRGGHLCALHDEKDWIHWCDGRTEAGEPSAELTCGACQSYASDVFGEREVLTQ